jgi:3-deoxy-D-manno-octulosonic-acid transferase
MPRLLYTLIYVLLLPLILLRLLGRSRLAPAYRKRWAERFGRFTSPVLDQKKPVIWLHAVSVGETLAAVPLVKKLQADHADWQWLITTTTPTGSERVQASFADSVFHVYAPYDVPVFISSFLKRTQPDLCIIMETELWPNMLAACRAQHIPSVVVNARLSEKSARGYRKLSPITRNMMESVTMIAAQQQNDGERFVQLGLPREKLVVTGSIKFDLDIDQAVRNKAKLLRAQWSINETRKVWLVASTHPGEDDIILAAFSSLKKQFPLLLLVLVPRHPERFNSIALLCQQAGWNVARRSDSAVVDAHVDIVLGDTMGELLVFYGAADMAFVGGSLVPVGGHNLIEPAAWACPVISGPYLFNFAEVERLLCDKNALVLVSSVEGIVEAVSHYLHDDHARLQAGLRASDVAECNRGALVHVVQLLEILIKNKP